MLTHVNHVSKLEFFCGFREAFFASMTEKNIQGGFAGAGLIGLSPSLYVSTAGSCSSKSQITYKASSVSETWQCQ
jgi:hypothetical protein